MTERRPPTKREARLAARERRRQSEATARTRRQLLKLGGLGAAAVGLLGVAGIAYVNAPYNPTGPKLEGEPKDLGERMLITTSEAYAEGEIKAPALIDLARSSTTDKDYLRAAFNGLVAARAASRQERFAAVYESTALVLPDPDKVLGANCFQIDRSGYYMTAAHVAVSAAERDTGRVAVYHPGTGRAFTVRDALIDEAVDIAFLYAPTGEPRGPIPGLELDASRYEVGQKLWMPFWHTFDKIRFRILHGTIKSTDQVHYPYYIGNIGVDGMQPYGGCSGAMVINEEARIRAVESGAIVISATVNARSNYSGARVAPITLAGKMLS
jgi:hypothetical protein